MALGIVRASLVLGVFGLAAARADDARPAPTLERSVMPLLKARCVKCHGPAKREGKLSLASPKGLARGGKQGVIVVAGQPDDSLIWTRVADEEMPPDDPLSDDEKAVLRRWIEAGAAGLPEIVPGEPEAADHWAFAPLRRQAPPAIRNTSRIRGAIDRFLQASLEAQGLTLGPEADRATLARRVSFDLTGVPLTPRELAAFLDDPAPNAYERLIERCLASPRYGERWGKYWLDAAGYADSNGYFAADSDRPLAYRYRDYVIRSWNQDKPLDRFVREQLAGDELSGFKRGDRATPERIDMLVATHFLRNSQDGTGESDGNPDELRADRYSVLEGTIEIFGSALFGLTFQCARCHDHKFEPVSQKEYYQLQAILYPAFPLEKWVKPNERIVEAPLPAEREKWEARATKLDAELAGLKADYKAWAETNREKGMVLFRDDFDGESSRLAPRWSHTAPGDDAPAGSPPVNVDSESAPGAAVKNGALRIIEAGGDGNRWLSTAQSFDWTPDEVGGWIQVTFDLVDRKVSAGDAPAERVGYYIALHDYQDNSLTKGGNVLIDGNPAGGAAIHIDYPGADTRAAGGIGIAGYEPGRRFGVRVTNQGGGRFRLEHLVDWMPEGKSVTLPAADLADGGFGFEYCCGRSFVVDNVLVEASIPAAKGSKAAEKGKSTAEKATARRQEYEKAVKAIDAQRGERPGRIAWVSDVSAVPPDVHLLRRGNYGDPGPTVESGVPAVLSDPDNPFEVVPPAEGASSTGRRMALARWITRPGSRASALLARVTANRIWQQHFGTGLVATPENLGYSGATPSHPALLDELARTLIESGWKAKALHRLIMNSAAYRQRSAPIERARAIDPDNRLLWRFPMRRLDAEALRDAMLAASGELEGRAGGPFVPARRIDTGEVKVDEKTDGAHRRSVYLQQRRTHVISVLEVFDSPSIVTNCTRRNATTIPLQSLTLLNSEFVQSRAGALARRLEREADANDDNRVTRAFLLTVGRRPSDDERAAASEFLAAQPGRYAKRSDAIERTWTDFCQSLLASSAFLYVE
jgi:hypothetical protein